MGSRGSVQCTYRLPQGDRRLQVDFTNHPLNRNTVLYSDSNKQSLSTVTVNSTVSSKDILDAVTDLIANPDYTPWYSKQLRAIGSKRFMELANKARAGSDTPQALFKWMLTNNSIVK